MNIKQKRKYIFLIGLAIVGIIIGFLFAFIISTKDKLLVESTMHNLFSNINENKIDYFKTFINSFSSSFIYTILIWILGISIIGIPFILFLLFLKGFIIGFSIGSFIRIYKIKGIFGSICFLFPHHIIIFLSYLLLSYFAIMFSKHLVDYLFLKKEINLRKLGKKYILILLICILCILLSSIIETFLSPIILKLFTKSII